VNVLDLLPHHVAVLDLLRVTSLLPNLVFAQLLLE
jgi:hypothetical protein